MSQPRTYTVVLSAAAKRAIERDLLEAVAVAVVIFLFGPLAAILTASASPCDSIWTATGPPAGASTE